MNSTQFIVSTDLDGTLLDHHSYDYTPALTAIQALTKLHIPIIVNTSKSQAEVASIVNELRLRPSIYIVENGSGLVLPNEYVRRLSSESLKGIEKRIMGDETCLVFGRERQDVTDFLYGLRAEKAWQFSGYSDWSLQQIMELTGLDESKARQSSHKAFSEPFIWQDSEAKLTELRQTCLEAGFNLVKGGRFYHLQGQCDKSTPLQFIKENVNELFPEKSDIKIIALGDNHNDIAMLNYSDYPICIKSPVNDFPNLNTQQPTLYSDEYGPAGWRQKIECLLNNLSLLES
ncbi:HAD-IIB family hydrolase [Bermanella marisrubri]|uniref:HAD-superfamily hydrolase YedP n=1 Tax=Bermanella marisrubri TaxID=207949 RepID=Q1MY86_9GAMM|nr:HAD-IIB family hydrolase [Bermanella marisrubri]EAT10924.1 HAD-superfamily hydrolase YedP [Oceanobacter sp. RED65] [Bermanella marisrubri]QIZ83732.1 HAD-IIB family hydrolase [Bermanella marisrubri]